MMNKRGEGTATRMIFLMLIFLTGVVTISTIVGSLAGSYGRTDIPEFQAYEQVYTDYENPSRGVIESQTLKNESGLVTERYDDSLLRQAAVTMRKVLNTLDFYSDSLSLTFKNLKLFNLPDEVQNSLFIGLGLIIVILILKAYWRYDKI